MNESLRPKPQPRLRQKILAGMVAGLVVPLAQACSGEAEPPVPGDPTTQAQEPDVDSRPVESPEEKNRSAAQKTMSRLLDQGCNTVFAAWIDKTEGNNEIQTKHVTRAQLTVYGETSDYEAPRPLTTEAPINGIYITIRTGEGDSIGAVFDGDIDNFSEADCIAADYRSFGTDLRLKNANNGYEVKTQPEVVSVSTLVPTYGDSAEEGTNMYEGSIISYVPADEIRHSVYDRAVATNIDNSWQDVDDDGLRLVQAAQKAANRIAEGR